jgi:cell wall-associated NlpC family hydrolase
VDVVTVKGSEIVAAARQLLGVPYVWWEEDDPIPMWSYDYPYTNPPIQKTWSRQVMCSDLVNFARQECGLAAIGGTPAYYDWLLSTGTGIAFDPTTDSVPGAICVNPGVWRGGSGQGHVAIYTDEHTLIEATDPAGVWEGEQDYDSHQWAAYWLYGLQPDVDYSESIKEPDPGYGGVVTDPSINWFGIGDDGIVRLGGKNVDWSRGWIGQDASGWLKRVK